MWNTFLAFGMTALLEYFVSSGPEPSECRILPQDDNWPKKNIWESFNRSVDGRLIRTIPIGTPCHQENFDLEKCQYVQDSWHEPELHLASASSMMDFIFANKSCDPFTAKTDQCIVGTYVQYAVNVSKVEHVFKTIEFVKQHNIRFVVRNTGHE